MSPDRKHAKIADILGYTFPRLHEGKKWYVDFRATDPDRHIAFRFHQNTIH